MKNIIIIGPPGSGKDTQIEEMSKYLDFQLVSTGDIVRKLAEKNEELRKVMNQGGLIDDSLILAEIGKKLDEIEDKTGVIFDGFPRTLRQAETLNELLLHHSRALDRVIYISLEENVIVERLSRRRVCSICGHNLVSGATKCGECGGRPIRRADDEPAVIIKRVQTYLENTLPLINYYRNKNILIEVDGDQVISAIARDIKEKLSEEL